MRKRLNLANQRIIRRVAYIVGTFLVALGWLRNFLSFVPFPSNYVTWGALAILTVAGVLFGKARLPYKLPLFYLVSQIFLWEASTMFGLSEVLLGAVQFAFMILLILLLEGRRAMRLCCPGRLEDRVYATRRLPGIFGRLRWTKLALLGAFALYIAMSAYMYKQSVYIPPMPLSKERLAVGIFHALTILVYQFVGPLLLIEQRLDEESVRILLVVFYVFPFYGLINGIISFAYAWLTVRSLQETRVCLRQWC